MKSSHAPIAKIIAPKTYSAVPRERLFRLLDRAAEKTVVWVTAPAGSGKTTLVSSWLDANKIPGLWLQLDAGAGAATFFYYLGRLRANNLMSFIGWNELRFTLDEVKDAVRPWRQDHCLVRECPGPEVLCEKTDGWAAGLRLMIENRSERAARRSRMLLRGIGRLEGQRVLLFLLRKMIGSDEAELVPTDRLASISFIDAHAFTEEVDAGYRTLDKNRLEARSA